MVIKALADYYDLLDRYDRLPAKVGWSNEKISFYICLNPDGSIDNIIDMRNEETTAKNKTVYVAREMQFPKREKTTSVSSHLIDTRPEYIFGMDFTKDGANPNVKKWTAFKDKHLEFFEDLDDRLCNAFKNHLNTWEPENNLENPILSIIANEKKGAGCAFCMTDDLTQTLESNPLVSEKWNRIRVAANDDDNAVYAQCAISGKEAKIARIHDNLKGIAGGQASGVSIVAYNNTAFESYGKKQSYNSNISEDIMQKYTTAFNFLSANRKHNFMIGDMTVLCWANSDKDDEMCEALSPFVSDGLSEEELEANETALQKVETVEEKLKSKLRNLSQGIATLPSGSTVDADTEFFLLGVTPNASRLCIKFFYRSTYGDILKNAYTHRLDMMIHKNSKPCPIRYITNELKSPNSKNDKISDELTAGLFKSVLFGVNYPNAVLAKLVQRIKVDSDTEKSHFIKMNPTRVGMIKACINRKLRLKNLKEEFTLALDTNNTNEAYLCGRLFAVIEMVQKKASGNLNKTIKDNFFAAACSTPAAVFPRLMELNSYHLSKLEIGFKRYYEKMMGDIISMLQTSYPKTLNLDDQGRFIIGYYQQNNELYTPKNKNNETTTD